MAPSASRQLIARHQTPSSAAGPKAEVTYVFAADSVSWRIRNLTEKKLTTLIAFDPGIRAVHDRFGQYEKTPAKFSSNTTTWFGNSTKLEISNGGRIWGPWSDEELQIWQHDLEPNEEHATLLKPALASPNELADVTAALNYVAVPPTNPVGPMWDLAELAVPPTTHPAEGFSEEGVQAIFYDGLPYKGRKTQVFAWLGVPDVPAGTKVPGIVLIHGGGGTAFAEWVRIWNARGYAAIAMDTCGGVPGGKPGERPRHAKSGPPGWGGYGQIDRPREDQWAYHAIADVILANSLLRAHPQVDRDRIGVTGISWGGYLCSMVAGVDDRFRFAVPVYGCGFTTDHAFAKSVTGLGEQQAARWMRWWDPSAYLADAKMPMLWVTGSNDFAYTFNALQKSYRLPKSPRTLCIRLRMPHGHQSGLGSERDRRLRGKRPQRCHAFDSHHRPRRSKRQCLGHLRKRLTRRESRTERDPRHRALAEAEMGSAPRATRSGQNARQTARRNDRLLPQSHRRTRPAREHGARGNLAVASVRCRRGMSIPIAVVVQVEIDLICHFRAIVASKMIRLHEFEADRVVEQLQLRSGDHHASRVARCLEHVVDGRIVEFGLVIASLGCAGVNLVESADGDLVDITVAILVVHLGLVGPEANLIVDRRIQEVRDVMPRSAVGDQLTETVDGDVVPGTDHGDSRPFDR